MRNGEPAAVQNGQHVPAIFGHRQRSGRGSVAGEYDRHPTRSGFPRGRRYGQASAMRMGRPVASKISQRQNAASPESTDVDGKTQ